MCVGSWVLREAKWDLHANYWSTGRKQWLQLSLETCQMQKCGIKPLLVSASAVCSQESPMENNIIIITFCRKLKQRVSVSTLCFLSPLFYSLNAWREDKDAPSKSQHVHSLLTTPTITLYMRFLSMVHCPN